MSCTEVKAVVVMMSFFFPHPADPSVLEVPSAAVTCSQNLPPSPLPPPGSPQPPPPPPPRPLPRPRPRSSCC